MRLPIYQVDAFTDKLFGGNPAAICPLETWLPDATMQAVAAENNLSETAFFMREGGDYALRWFTPVSRSICAGTRRLPRRMSCSAFSSRNATACAFAPSRPARLR
jgi:PhzF family phenazine biosynthesis protein